MANRNVLVDLAAEVFRLAPADTDDYVPSSSVLMRRFMIPPSEGRTRLVFPHRTTSRSGRTDVDEPSVSVPKFIKEAHQLGPYELTLLRELATKGGGILILRGHAGSGKSSIFIQLCEHLVAHSNLTPPGAYGITTAAVRVSARNLRTEFGKAPTKHKELQIAKFFGRLADALYSSLLDQINSGNPEVDAANLVTLFENATNHLIPRRRKTAKHGGGHNDGVTLAREMYRAGLQSGMNVGTKNTLVNATFQALREKSSEKALAVVLRMCMHIGEAHRRSGAMFIVILDDLDVVAQPYQSALIEIFNLESENWDSGFQLVAPVRLSTFARLEPILSPLLAADGSKGTFIFKWAEFTSCWPHEIVVCRLVRFLLQPEQYQAYELIEDEDKAECYRRFAQLWYHLTAHDLQRTLDAAAGTNLRDAMLLVHQWPANRHPPSSDSVVDLSTVAEVKTVLHERMAYYHLVGIARGMERLLEESIDHEHDLNGIISAISVTRIGERFAIQASEALVERIYGLRGLRSVVRLSESEFSRWLRPALSGELSTIFVKGCARFKNDVRLTSISLIHRKKNFVSAFERKIATVGPRPDLLDEPERSILGVLRDWVRDEIVQGIETDVDLRTVQRGFDRSPTYGVAQLFGFERYERSRFLASRALLGCRERDERFSFFAGIANVFTLDGEQVNLAPLYALLYVREHQEKLVADVERALLEAGFNSADVSSALKLLTAAEHRLLWVGPRDHFSSPAAVKKLRNARLFISEAGIQYLDYLSTLSAYLYIAFDEIDSLVLSRIDKQLHLDLGRDAEEADEHDNRLIARSIFARQSLEHVVRSEVDRLGLVQDVARLKLVWGFVGVAAGVDAAVRAMPSWVAALSSHAKRNPTLSKEIGTHIEGWTYATSGWIRLVEERFGENRVTRIWREAVRRTIEDVRFLGISA